MSAKFMEPVSWAREMHEFLELGCWDVSQIHRAGLLGRQLNSCKLGCCDVSQIHGAGLLGCQPNSWSRAVGMLIKFMELGC
jgi:hypothetical protein